MDTQQLIDIATAQVTAFNESDWDKVSSLFAPNCVYEELATGRAVTGTDEFVTLCKGWKSAFSDTTGEVTRSLTSGNTVVLEITWTGTHDGPLPTETGTIAASGNSVPTPAVQIIEIVDGKIAKIRHYFDMLALLTAVGAIGGPEAQAAGA